MLPLTASLPERWAGESSGEKTPTMVVYKIELSRDALFKFSEAERRAFLVLAHVDNENNALRRMVCWSSDFSSGSPDFNNGQTAQLHFALRLWVGKLIEAYQAIARYYHGSKLSQEYSSLLPEAACSALKVLKKLCAKSGRLNRIRNDLSFHYTADLNSPLAELEEPLEMYLQQPGQANTLFYFAEVLVARALAKEFPEDKDPYSLADLLKEVDEASKATHKFIEQFLLAVIKKYEPEVWSGKARPVILGELKSFNEVRIPWFTDASELGQAQLNRPPARSTPPARPPPGRAS